MYRINALIISMICVSAWGFAQTQMPNSNFEQWTTTDAGNAIPKYWHSFGDADCQLSGLSAWGCPFVRSNHSNRVAGHRGYGCEIYAKYVAGIVNVNGVITTGQMLMASSETDNDENYNYSDIGNRCGNKASISFTGRPDSVYFWCKFEMKKPSNFASAKFHLHGNIPYKDISRHQSTTAQKGKIANAFCEFADPNDGKWHQYKFKFTYYDESNRILKSTANKPSYILASFSTNKITKGGSSGDKLIIDDIEMIYNKRLSYIRIDGMDLPNFNSNIMHYEYQANLSSGILPSVTASAQSQNARISITPPSKENGYVASIIVRHDDGEQIYTVHFSGKSDIVEK